MLRICAALLHNIRAGAFVEGGSTITQQLAKMLFLTPEKTITRKIKEIALAFQLERRYTKDELLGMYLNHAYLGTRAYGIEAAAHTYFAKTTQQLTVAEAVLLATLPKAPSKHSPFKDPERALRRRNFALKKMLGRGYITAEKYSEAIRAPLPVKINGRSFKSPFFVDYARSVLEDRYGDRLYTSGMKIYTTLDFHLQESAEAAVEKGIEELRERGITGVQAALLAIEQKTGRIKAMVGGTNYQSSQFNRAVLARRQPGSSFKPLVYLTALNLGFTPADVIEDEKVTYRWAAGSWTPQNYNNVYLGRVSLQEAMAKSLNAATINLTKRVGITSIITTAQRLGITSTIHPFDSSALGASELTLLELVCAYSALGHGYRITPEPIDRIIDREQPFLIEPSGSKERVIGEKTVEQIRTMLRSVVLEGTGKKAGILDRPVYGKTGTSNNCADAWFIGFDDTLVTGVWVGRDDRSPIASNETGSTAALPIWIEFMKNAGSKNGPGKPQILAVTRER